ncbi:cupin domain-containing protein [Cupriavidus sp. RAF12]|uniref:cupin domain-containing protein n=1 Tax=Cupriavidus sp. RAF12 TaxID=3233050 RepID=UPI003F90D261
MHIKRAFASGPGSQPRADPTSGAFCSAAALTMSPSPINPDWLHSGQPMTRCGEHSLTFDGFASTSVWDCTRSTFDWHYTVDEIVYILEGEVRVTDAHGRTYTLKAGSIGYFPAHTSWFWEVDHYVRKVAICKRAVPAGLRLPIRVLGKLDIEGWWRRSARARERWAALWARFHGSTTMVMLMALPL